MRTVKQWLDIGFPCCRRTYTDEEKEEMDNPDIPKTKKTTIYQFVQQYAGPVYLIQSKYSAMMVIIFTTFMYGMALPILFPICLLALFNMYFIETYCLVYFYRKPPMYDGKLDSRALTILRYPPLLMFAFGYWAISNSQMFLNVPPELFFFNRPPNP